MRVLALDTTTRAGSVALVEDDRVVSEQDGDASRTHAERLPQEILSLLDACGFGPRDIDVFAVASGPGSFTGLRIGIATMQGLAFVERRPIVPVSALEAHAQIAARDAGAGTLIGAWMDAARHEVFTALYRVAPSTCGGPYQVRLPFDPTRLIEIEAPAVGDPQSTLDRWSAIVTGERTWLAGEGAVQYADTIRAHASHGRVIEIAEPVPLAGAIGLMAVARARLGEMSGPAAVRPLYVRRPDAEIDRERKAFATTDRKNTK